MVTTTDRQAYRAFQAQEALLSSSIDYQSDYRKYVVRAYHYIRARLLVPGRCYESEDFGPMALGSPAHCDVIDLDVWLTKQDNSRLSEDALDWMCDSSPEEVAHMRSLVRIPLKDTIKKKRQRIIHRANADLSGIVPINSAIPEK